MLFDDAMFALSANHLSALFHQLEPVNEDDEKETKKKKKKHKKEKKKKEKERGEKDDSENAETKYEKKLSNISLGPNIQVDGDKPDPPQKLFQPRKSTEHGVTPLLDIEVATENLISPENSNDHPMSPRSPASMVWSPKRRFQQNNMDNEKSNVLAKPRAGLKHRISKEQMRRYMSSESEDEVDSGRFTSQWNKEKSRQRRQASSDSN